MTNQQLADRPRVVNGQNDISGPKSPGSHNLLYKRWRSELWAGHRIAQELVSPDFVGHWPTGDVHGPDELQALIDRTRARLRELLFVVDVGPFTDGDMVAARWIGTGSGANGPARLTGNDIVRVANGKIAEYWTCTAAA